MKTVISIAIEPQLLAQLDAVTKPHGRSRSWFISQAIGHLLATGPRLDPGALAIPDGADLDQRVEHAVCRVLGVPLRQIDRARRIAAAAVFGNDPRAMSAEPDVEPAAEPDAEPTQAPRGKTAKETA